MPGIVLLTTVPDLKTAKLIAKSLVSRKLAACVSFRGGFHSYYRWKGKIARASEALLLIKTVKGKFNKIKTAIKAMHPYELPEIISLPIAQGCPEYLAWLNRALDR